jgi:hypothetical protein
MRSDVYLTAKPDLLLKNNIIAALQRTEISQDNKEKLAENILLKIRWRLDSQKYYSNNTSVAEHLEKIESYIESLNAVRKAWLALPLMTKHILPEMMPDVGSSLLDTSLLSSKFYNDKSSLPEWRLKGLSGIEEWGSDLELIDLLKATAILWKDKYFIGHTRRDSTHVGLVAGIAEACTAHGIKVSHTPRSYFVRILMLVFPDLTSPPKNVIAEARALLLTSG